MEVDEVGANILHYLFRAVTVARYTLPRPRAIQV